MKKLFLYTCFILFAGCAPAPKLLPLEDGLKVNRENFMSVYEGEEVKILVKAQAWKYSPSDLPYYVTPLYMEVKNLSQKNISIDRHGIYLLDDRGNQYNALSPGEVSSMLSYSVGFSLGMAYYSSPYWFGWYPYYPYYPPTYPDILNYAFVYGTVEPKAILKGFLYFQKLPKEIKNVTLKITYRVNGETKSVSFPFQVENK
ncbi:MAG: hypothetical protein KNN13_04960 [Hydrogenobacter thermophilus]|uniref:hypothetical protein n=1 Tax=Hydrogenobacter thermophilus TaxID=940 RepID=UPI001C74798F|nr:hypothetical protein [Hydrogenobacter thermophilus]QWK20669.1 MAG: hypothetical protein KNN13_04960 [Hydrogenobacter thermophilus]